MRHRHSSRGEIACDDYPKADQDSYLQIADAIGASSIDVVSLEDAYRHNDLSLLERLKTTTVVFGVVAIARSQIESVEEIRTRLAQALNHIDGNVLSRHPIVDLAC